MVRQARKRNRTGIYHIMLRAWIEGRYGIDAILAMPYKTIGKEIKEIYTGTGTSVRQLSRVLGIGRATVGKAVRVDG